MLLRFMLVVAALTAAPGLALAECGHEQLRISGTADEIAMTCKALEAVAGYFGELGETEVPALQVRFEEAVQFPGDNSLSLAGLFRGDEGTIEVVSPSSSHPGRALHWGQPWTMATAYSVLEHELAHAFAYPIGGKDLDYAWSEFVAYAVQFAVMEPAYRAKILTAYPEATPYENIAMVCDLRYLSDVDLFAVRSYLTAEARGGRRFVSDVLSGAYPTKAPRRFDCPAAGE